MNPYIAWPRSAKVASVLFMVIAGGFLLTAAKAILIPIALAVLVSFLLHPIVKRLYRAGVHRIVSVILVVGGASILVAGMGFVVSSQLKSFADELPAHEANIRDKVKTIKSMFRGGTLDRLSGLVERIDKETEVEVARDRKATAPDAPQTALSSAERGSPVAAAGRSVLESVEVAPASANRTPQAAKQPPAASPGFDSSAFFGTTLMGTPILSSAIEVLATVGIVILLVTFFLIQQSDIRDRIVSVAGRGALATTTKALEEAGSRISRYLLMLFVVNSTYGIAVGIGLWLMGVPYAIMWGLAAGTIRYVPYIGPWIGALMPIGTSLVTSAGWTQPLMVLGLFIVLELISNNVMEPILYGHSVGISEVGVILSAIIWAWLWGPIGLVLATPMTVCFVVLGRYVPGLRIFDHLLGDRAAVTPFVRLYQRLLAKDAEDAEELVEHYLTERSRVETADQLIIPAVELIQQDLAHDQIDDDDAARMNTMLADLIDETLACDDAATAQATEGAPLVVGVAAHSNEETVLLELLNAVCSDVACRIEVLSSDLLQAERLAAIRERSPDVVIVSSLPPGDLPHARQMCKRLKASGAARRIVVARWGKGATTDRSQQLVAAGADDVVSTIAELESMVKTAFHMHRASRPSSSSPQGPKHSTRAQAG